MYNQLPKCFVVVTILTTTTSPLFCIDLAESPSYRHLLSPLISRQWWGPVCHGRGWWYMGRARLWVVLWRPIELDSVRDCGINEYYDLYCCVFASFLGIRIQWWRVTLAGIWHSCSYSLLVFQHWFYRQDLCHFLILVMLSVSSHIAYWTADNDVGDGNRSFVLLYISHVTWWRVTMRSSVKSSGDCDAVSELLI